MNSNDMVKAMLEVYKLDLDYQMDGEHLLKRNDLYVCLTEPHEGTEFKYMLRADYPEIFDKWSNCIFEEFFNEDEFTDTLNKLTVFIIEKEKNIKESLED